MFIGMLLGSMASEGNNFLEEINCDPEQIRALKEALHHIYKQTYAEDMR